MVICLFSVDVWFFLAREGQGREEDGSYAVLGHYLQRNTYD